jgi:hypothetical protein
MKHIIVVETPDENILESKEVAELQHIVCAVVESLFDSHYPVSFIQSRFCEDSAIVAVKKMYNVED